MDETTRAMLDQLSGRVSRVRRWLVSLAVLRVAAIGFVAVSAYIICYSILDRYLSFGTAARFAALGGLCLGTGGLAIYLVKSLLRHISSRNAANHIDQSLELDQQLTTAIEFGQALQNGEYPYSRALAREVVRQVHVRTVQYDFAATVPKWQAWVAGLVITLGLVSVGWYVHHNYTFFSRYFVRLTQPLAAVESEGATHLRSITEDLTVEPMSMVNMSAAIEGRLPAEGTLVIEPADAGDSTEAKGQRLALTPTYDSEDKPVFESDTALPLGSYRYRFECEEAASQWHSIAVADLPRLDTIRAKVTPPTEVAGQETERDLEEYQVEAYEGSQVTLTAQATVPLSASSVTGPNGKALPTQDNSGNTFSVSFTAKEDGFISFALEGENGMRNEAIPKVQVIIKRDAPPALELVTPGGDYLATDVASIPISFRATDDFGVKGGTLTLEIADEEPLTIPMTVEGDGKSAVVSHTLDLDGYDLEVGDSIMFYATANDVDAGLTRANAEGASEIYFIEIRPYRQLWHQSKPGLPGMDKQGLKRMPGHATIKAILEYTRAFVKKTWNLAKEPAVEAEERGQMDAIMVDIDHTAEQLAMVRDDPRYKFGQESIALINEILGEYRNANEQLKAYSASGALKHEKKAYQILRKLLLVLHHLDPTGGGGGGLKAQPDRVKLEEQVHLTRYEKEHVDWQLRRLANKLEEMIEEQEEMQRSFEHFLKVARAESLTGQEVTDERSWLSDEKARKKSQNQGQPSRDGEPPLTQESGQPTVEGAMPPASPAEQPPQGQMQGASGSEGQSGSSEASRGQEASRQEQLNMLRARQKSLTEAAKELQEQLADSQPGSAEEQEGQNQAKKQLEAAIQAMEQFDRLLSEAQYKAEGGSEALRKALEALEKAGEELGGAHESLQHEIDYTDKQRQAVEDERVARLLDKVADDIEKTDDPMEQQRLEEILKQRWESFDEEPLIEDGQYPSGPYYGPVTTRSAAHSRPEPGPGPTNFRRPAEMARFLARAYRTRSMETRKEAGRLAAQDASGAEYHRMEKLFFEKAAHYEK